MLKLLTEYDEHISPIALAFQDLWIRAIALMPKEWSLRFGKIMQQNAFASFLESYNLHHGICPSSSAYIQERRKAGFVFPCFVCTMYPRFSNTLSNCNFDCLMDFVFNKVWRQYGLHDQCLEFVKSLSWFKKCSWRLCGKKIHNKN